MAQLVIALDLDNDAMQEPEDIAAVVTYLATHIVNVSVTANSTGHTKTAFDVNGNSVGQLGVV